MEKLIVLGTGTGGASKCYNTCFAFKKGEEYLLVDGGGGSQIFNYLNKSDIPLTSIHNIFVSHNHIDHIIGVIWVIRKISTIIWLGDTSYEGNLNIYASDKTIEAIKTICNITLEKGLADNIGKRIKLNVVQNREIKKILNEDIMFFDICAQKEQQFGFKILNSEITFTGDDICREQNYDLVENSKWLLHEAFCRYEDREVFSPYKKGHCTVKEACEIADKLNVENLVLWHSEDKNIEKRKELYKNEAKQYFSGRIYVPNDLDVIEI